MKNALRSHQWKSFVRNPMFNQNLAIRIFSIIMFSLLALELLLIGIMLDKILLGVGLYNNAVDTFNFFLIFLFLADFVIKFFFKKNQSIQIIPYLTLPIKRQKLFNFLLCSEFNSFWNLFWLFLVVPFTLIAVTPVHGTISAVLYIVFFYLTCIVISLVINYINNLLDKSNWYFAIPIALVALPFLLLFGFNVPIGEYVVQFGEWILQKNFLAWLAVIFVFGLLWLVNRSLMREIVYNEMQGEKLDKISSFNKLSFLDNFGQMGLLINNEIKLIMRSKRLKQQFYVMPFFVLYTFFFIYSGPGEVGQNMSFQLFFFMFIIGYSGLIMGQYLFTSESSFFDGLMVRNISFYTMLKGKYFLYSAVSLFMTLLFLIPAFQGKISFLLIFSLFFFVIGFIYFLVFQNAVYNKSHFDPFDGSMMNWKGTSSSMLIITMLTMFVPFMLILGIHNLWGSNVACYVMLSVGVVFTLANNIWLKWTYDRFWKRRYTNMDGFRQG